MTVPSGTPLPPNLDHNLRTAIALAPKATPAECEWIADTLGVFTLWCDDHGLDPSHVISKYRHE